MRTFFLIITSCFAFNLMACKGTPGEQVLFSYARAAGAYAVGDLETAAIAAKESLAMDRRFLPAAIVYGKICYFSGQDEDAIKSLLGAVKLSPRAGEAALWLARSYRAAGKLTEARKTCELLLSADSQSIAGLRLAACLALDLDNVAAAIAYLDRAVESAGETGLVFADRAALRWAAGDASGTQADLEAALVTLPRGSAAWQSTEGLLSRITGGQP